MNISLRNLLLEQGISNVQNVNDGLKRDQDAIILLVNVEIIFVIDVEDHIRFAIVKMRF
jgi:hypothetical protein